MYIVASDDGQHGLLIRDRVETYYEADINHARLYPNLDALAERGLIEKATGTNAQTGMTSLRVELKN